MNSCCAVVDGLLLCSSKKELTVQGMMYVFNSSLRVSSVGTRSFDFLRCCIEAQDKLRLRLDPSLLMCLLDMYLHYITNLNQLVLNHLLAQNLIERTLC